MTLHKELEPPSSVKTKKDLKLNISQSSIYQKLAQIKLANSIFVLRALKTTTIKLASLIKQIWNNNIKFIPHFALVSLLLVVLLSNLDETAKAKALSSDFVNVDPDVENSIVQNVGQYTDLIEADEAIVDQSNLALNLKDGFAANIAPVDTKITMREEPLPDNSTDTVYYVVRPGDTLTGLGWKFGVKLATLKYTNDIDNVNTIKPGVRLKIPPKGYEVAASLIAKKENEKAQKLASANRNTVARNQSTARTATGTSYYGTSGGVRYIEKSYGQCYTYVTSLGYNVGGHLLAKWIPTNSDTPRVGGLVVTYESWAGHVAVVIAVNGDGTFDIRERNYTPGWITERTLNVNSGKIKGFVN